LRPFCHLSTSQCGEPVTAADQDREAGVGEGRGLNDSFPFWDLTGDQEGLYQFPFAADDHPREAPVPVAFGDLGLAIEPCSHEFELLSPYLAFSDPIKEMVKQRRRNAPSSDPGHGSDAVEAASHSLSDLRGRPGIAGAGQSSGEALQLGR
jgi:hypothetical protein